MTSVIASLLRKPSIRGSSKPLAYKNVRNEATSASPAIKTIASLVVTSHTAASKLMSTWNDGAASVVEADVATAAGCCVVAEAPTRASGSGSEKVGRKCYEFAVSCGRKQIGVGVLYWHATLSLSVFA